jgi:hypothetical protein
LARGRVRARYARCRMSGWETQGSPSQSRTIIIFVCLFTLASGTSVQQHPGHMTNQNTYQEPIGRDGWNKKLVYFGTSWVSNQHAYYSIDIYKALLDFVIVENSYPCSNKFPRIIKIETATCYHLYELPCRNQSNCDIWFYMW